MNIRVLVENTNDNKALSCEHGLSLYIEANGAKILFDMGQSDLFFENAKKMGVDISKVDAAFLSHGHYDHGGGIETFLKHNSRANVYVNRYAFNDYESMDSDTSAHYIGLNTLLKGSDRIIISSDDYSPFEWLHVFSNVSGNICTSVANRNLIEVVDGKWKADTFRHEQNMIISDNGKNVLFSGCAHAGIVNIINTCSALIGRAPDAVVGGFHLCMYDGDGDTVFANQLASQLARFDTIYYTGHCTGLVGYEMLKKTLNDRLTRINTGMGIIV